jgi:hypothetical protein
MQRRQSVFDFFGSRSLAVALVLTLLLSCTAATWAQVNTATLTGTVTDPKALPFKGAKITVTNAATAASRSTVTDENGRYSFVGVAPGKYKLTADGGADFASYENNSVEVTVGESAILDVQFVLKTMVTTVTVSAEAVRVDPTKTEVSRTVGEFNIESLPLKNGKYTDFVFTDSSAKRDVSPTIGPAPNSGYSVGGARARSNNVSIDGASAVDNSINGIRSTVSQEGVQEFQLISSNYNAEYGQATGGVINIVTKSGSNDFHGSLYGYLRNKAFQARNAFSGQIDPTTGNLDPIKQAYTRTQSGFTLGGPLKKDKTFMFLSYEYAQREETGFSSIGVGNFGMVGVPLPPSAGGITVQLTPSQAAAVNALLTSGSLPLATLGVHYALFMGSASSVALNGLDYGAVAQGFGFPNPGPGARFPIPVQCPAGLMVNAMQCSPAGFGLAPLPASFVPLSKIRGNYPVMEKTSQWSARMDHRWNDRNHSFLRVGVSPSLATGLPSTSQNQVFGQNSGSRAGYNQSRDLSFTFQHDTIVGKTDFNEFRTQVARRGLHFGFSQLPGGGDIGVNIPGYAYFGREPYSRVDRIERRFEFTDNVTLVRGGHTIKMGGDVNVIQLRSKKAQIFELDFGGDVNFGGFSASTFGFPNSVAGISLPGTTGLQSYGLGVPTTYIQGIGSSNQPFDNLPFGFFLQDSWRINNHLSLNYGVRYDVEITPLFAPLGPVSAAAEKVMGVLEGIPRDYNNFAPRFGLAWDPSGKGKMVIRAGYGMFYDHPLLAVAFDSATADGGRSTQLISTGGVASACGLLPLPNGVPASAVGYCGGGADSPTNLNGSSIFQGVLNANSIYLAFPTSLTLGYLPNEQRFDPYASGSLFANQNYLSSGFPLPILPFTLPVAKNFVYSYAHQANLTIEREIAGSWKFSLGYQWTRGLHLNRPQDLNSTDPKLLAQNFFNAAASGLSVSNPLTVVVPSGTANTCVPTGTGSMFLIAPGALAQGFAVPGCNPAGAVGFVGTPAFFNFFRPSGPNPSFAGLVPGGYSTQVFLAGLANYPKGFGVPVPFNSVDAQVSNGNSWYNAVTFNLSKRIARRFELLSSYTYSHAIDDSTDLQSTLEPPDSRFPALDRSNYQLCDPNWKRKIR